MLQHDLRHAIRWLRGNAGFAAAALLVLGLGIGAATATFTVIHTVMLRPLPFDAPDRVIRIWSSVPQRNLPFFSVSPEDMAAWRARATTLATVAAYDRQRPATLDGGGEPEQIMIAGVGHELFEVLGVPPAIGRTFTGEEDEAGSDARVAVIAHGLWQRRFGSRPDVTGQTLRLNGQNWKVIGVMPAGFAIPNNPAEIWLPLQLTIDPARRGERFLRVLARLRDDVTIEQATSELEGIAADLARDFPSSNRIWTVTVQRLVDTVVSENVRRALIVVAGAVGLVLLIACANVASLLLSLATTRTREMAVRTAMGASRWALVRQLLTESLVLAAGGGLLGVLLAMWGLDVLASLAVTTVPRADEITLRPPVLLFACAVTTMTALLFGLAPAIGASRAHSNALRVRDAGGVRGATRLRDLLVVAEVALAVVLLVGAGLLMRSFVRLQQRDLGFDPARLLLVDVAPLRPEASTAFYEALAARLNAIPGVETVAAGSSLPFAGPNSGSTLALEGRTYEPGEQPDADFRVVTPEYFRTLGIPLLRGRTFTSADTAAVPAVIVNATFARQYFAGEDPIGRRVRLGGDRWTIIVGVVGNARYLSLDDPTDDLRPMAYLPPAQMPAAPQTIVLKASGPPASIAPAVRAAVRAIAPMQPIVRLEPMEQILAAARGPQRFNAAILAVFAWIALVLAAAGLWALISHGVMRRTREIGIRVALGARPADVLRMTAGRGVMLACAGIILGLVAARGANALLQTLLFDLSATDPATFAGIAAVFLVVAAAASLLPARRALRIHPAEALRLE